MFDNYQTVFSKKTDDNVNIRIDAKANTIPKDATFKVEEVSLPQQEKIDTTIKKIEEENTNVAESFTYDIKILDKNGIEIEPSKDVKIVFEHPNISNKNLDTIIYHTYQNEKKQLETEVLESSVEGNDVEAFTDSFSYYTVAFTYNNKTYNLGGDEEVRLQDILDTLELTGEVTNVESSNNELFYSELREDGYYIVSKAPFDTEEYLNVTIDGIVYKINVTDATITIPLQFSTGPEVAFYGQVTYTYTVTTNTDTSYAVNITSVVYKNTSGKSQTFQQGNYNIPMTVTVFGSLVRTYTGTVANGSSITLWTGTKSKSWTKTHDTQTEMSAAHTDAWMAGASWDISIPAKTHYTITYNANGGTVYPETDTKWYGESLTLPTTGMSRTGYNFVGWYTAASGGTKYGATYTANAAAIIYAHWEEKPKYTITYNANGGTYSDGTTFTEEKTEDQTYYINYVTPSRTGYKFVEYTTNQDGTGTSYSPGSSYTSNANLTLFAQWVNTFDITYHMNNNSCYTYIASQTKEIGVDITLSSIVPTCGRYTFQKWNTKDDNTGVDYNPGDTYTNDEDLDLYAVWTKNAPVAVITKNWVDGFTGSAAENRPKPTLKISKYLTGQYPNTSGTNQTYTDDWDWLSIFGPADQVIFTYNYTNTETQFSATVTKIQFKTSSGTAKTFTSTSDGDNRLAIEFDGTIVTYWSGTIPANTTTTIWSGSRTVTANKSASSSSLSSKCKVYRVKDQNGFLYDSGDLAVTVPGLSYFTITTDELVKSSNSQWKYNLYPNMNAENSNMNGWYLWEETVPSNYVSNRTVSNPVQISNGAASITNTIEKQSLTISESVKGGLADINKNFTFTLNAINNSVGISGSFAYTGTRSGTLTFTEGNATFNLKHGENLTIELPKNCTYTITQNSDGYTLAKTNDSGTLSSDISSSFVDTLAGTTPTGIFIDLIPHVLMIIFGVSTIIGIIKFKKI